METVKWKNDTTLGLLEVPDNEQGARAVQDFDGFSPYDFYYLQGTVKQINDDNLQAYGFSPLEVTLYEGYIVKCGAEDTSYGKKNKSQIEEQGILSERQEGLFMTCVPGISDTLHILYVGDGKYLLTCYRDGAESWSFQGKLEMVADKIYSWYTNEYVIPVVGKSHLKFAKPGDAGVDLKAVNECNVYPKGWQGEKSDEQGLSDFELQAQSNNVTIVHTELHVAIPERYMGIIVPRSGIALKHGVQVVNTPGIIDSGYRGEIMIGLVNHGNELYHVNKGDRVAQLIIVPFRTPSFIGVDTLGETERGVGGFGSTGIN